MLLGALATIPSVVARQHCRGVTWSSDCTMPYVVKHGD
jgi:hypothetical protein